MKSKLRIIETLQEMQKEPRINGLAFMWLLPSVFALGCLTLKAALAVSTALFILCFLAVRFTLNN